MSEEEKERLIKKDISSIENRVRHAFNQGYEMGLKERKNTCEDAISRQAVLDATVKRNSIWNKITNSKGENLEEIISQLPPVTPQEPCDVPDINVGDMISRKAVLNVLEWKWAGKAAFFGYMLLFGLCVLMLNELDDGVYLGAFIIVGIVLSLHLAIFICSPESYGYQKITVSENVVEAK